jgi:hypothetical protein
VLVAYVVHAKVHGRAVAGRGEHHLIHDLRHEYLLVTRRRLFLSLLGSVVVLTLFLVDPLRVLSLFFVEEGGDPVLSPKLYPCLLR